MKIELHVDMYYGELPALKHCLHQLPSPFPTKSSRLQPEIEKELFLVVGQELHCSQTMSHDNACSSKKLHPCAKCYCNSCPLSHVDVQSTRRTRYFPPFPSI